MHMVVIKITCKRAMATTFNRGDSFTNVLLSTELILQLGNHSCIISLEDVINTSNFLFIVLKLAEGREAKENH